jgi:hypothetical protein
MSSTKRAPPPAGNNASSSSQEQPIFSDLEQKELVKYALLFIGVSAAMKVLFSMLFVFYLLAAPVLYLYALQQCPSPESFDAKKELKRVLRGKHLPETHPDKPKGFLESVAARVAATVTTELATLPGYQVQMTNLAGAAIVSSVKVPSAKMECYWVGAFGTWFYITARELSSDIKRD